MPPVVGVTSIMKTEKEQNLVPINDILVCCKRKRDFYKLNIDEESEKSESSEEEEVERNPKKKIIKIISEPKNPASEEESDSDYEKEIHKYAKKKVVKDMEEENKINKDDDDDDDDDDDSDSDSEAAGLSYEEMIEKKRAERLALLQSLKIDEVKASFSEVAGIMKKKTQPVKKTYKKPECRPVPVRRSRRLEKKGVDFSEDSLFYKAIEDAKKEIQVDFDSPLPAEMAFKEALRSDNLYESYATDVSIQKPTSKGKLLSYDRCILQSLTIHDCNVAKVVPERITSLAWYPSAEHQIVVAGSKTGNIGVWNVDSESSPYVFKIHNQGSTSVQFNPFNSIQLFSSSYEGVLRCGDMVKHIFSEVYNVSDETCCTYFDFLSPTTYLVAQMNGKVALVDRRSEGKKSEKKHTCHDYSIKTVNIHPVNKNYFVTAENRGSVRLWDLRKLQKNPVADLRYHKRCVNSAFFSPATGNSILTTSMDNSVCVFDSTNLTQDINLIRRMNHNNVTGRWLSIFRASWLPNSDEIFVIGSMQDCPRRIEIFDKEMNVYHIVKHDNLTTITSNNAFHPFRPALAGGNSSGKVFVFT